MTDDSDTADLMRRAKAGDREALGRLLERHLPGVRAFVRLNAGRAIRERESTSDLVQSICREVLEDVQTLASDEESAFKKWLFTAAARKIVDRDRHIHAARRDARRETPIDDDTSRAPELAAPYAAFRSPSGDLAMKDEIRRIEEAFDRLPDDQRRVLTLTSIVGLSCAEVATALDKSEVAVRQALSRARARLAMLLDPSA